MGLLARSGGIDAGLERPEATARLLVFTIHGEPFALSVSMVGGLADCSELRPVRRAPDVVLGLTEWRGQLLTVLDLPRALGFPAAEPPLCLVRLAPPLDETAFRVPATVRLGPDPARTTFESAGSDLGVVAGHVLHEGERIPLLDPRRLVERIEATVAGRD